MKFLTLLFPLTAGIVASSTYAQTHQGSIRYERKIDVHRHLADPQMKAMVPQFQTAFYDLAFNDSISVYKTVPKDEAPDPFDNQGGTRVNIRFNGPGDEGVLYKNFSSNRQLEETTLEDTKYVILDSIKTFPWKLSEETSTVLGHPCKMATTTTSRGSKVIAWYAQDIPVPIGPDKFNGLPGAMLKLDVDSSGLIFTATQINPTASPKDLKVPTSGKSITRADYDKKLDHAMGPADAQGRRIQRN